MKSSLLECKEFLCDKCKCVKSTDRALMGRDPRINYNICGECRDILVGLIQENEFKTILSFLDRSE